MVFGDVEVFQLPPHTYATLGICDIVSYDAEDGILFARPSYDTYMFVAFIPLHQVQSYYHVHSVQKYDGTHYALVSQA